MNCKYCDEEILPGETVPGERAPNLYDLHHECAIRIVIGSAAHHLNECLCFGGSREDPPGMTRRQAARLALETFQLLRGQVPA